MKEDKNRVVIIDNQFMQFSSLSELLPKGHYEFFPEESTFNDFMDNIKIIIDPRYPQDYRDRSINEIKTRIAGFEPDVLVIDYILGGSHKCETGVDLANRIVCGKKPVLFVSIENKNEKIIREKLIEYKWMYDWAEKERFQWYSNQKIKNEDYYYSNIIKNINTLIGRYRKIKGDFDDIIAIIKEFQYQNDSSFRDNRIVLDDIKKRTEYLYAKGQIPSSISEKESGEISLLLRDANKGVIKSFSDELWRKFSLFCDKLKIDA